MFLLTPSLSLTFAIDAAHFKVAASSWFFSCHKMDYHHPSNRFILHGTLVVFVAFLLLMTLRTWQRASVSRSVRVHLQVSWTNMRVSWKKKKRIFNCFDLITMRSSAQQWYRVYKKKKKKEQVVRSIVAPNTHCCNQMLLTTLHPLPPLNSDRRLGLCAPQLTARLVCLRFELDGGQIRHQLMQQQQERFQCSTVNRWVDNH